MIGNDWKKGKPKTGGRKKGSVNEKTKTLQELAKAYLDGKSIPERMLELAKANPRLELDILKELLPYVQPKLSSMTLDAKVEDVTGDRVKNAAEKAEQLAAEEIQFAKSSRAV